MNNKRFSLFLAGMLLVASFNGTAYAEDTATEVATQNNVEKIWVSPGGSDTNDGRTIETPLRSFAAAKYKAEVIKKETNAPIEVLFRGGEYRQTGTIHFSQKDSGTIDAPITYKAYNGEKVEFKGSIEVDETKGTRVTDPEILSKMYSSVHDKVVCFDLRGFGLTSEMVRQPAKEDGWRALVNGEVNGIYLDGVPQTVAEWPNGEGNYTYWEKSLTADTIQYTQTEPNRWAKATDFWLAGYPGYDFYYVRQSVLNIDTSAKTLTTHIPGSALHGFISAQSRRWKAQNLLEEIDIPGEYYIDPIAMKLYLYPSKSLKDTKMEISWMKDSIIKIMGAVNIRFEGLTFCQTRGSAVLGNDVKNIDFINCRFDNILSHAIQILGTQKAETDKDYWQNQAIHGSYDCDIIGCVFYEIGGGAIELDCGDLDTLTPSGNVIRDNMIYHANILSKNNCVILLRGCGATVENNNISKCPFQAIRHYGNDFVIRYNEIHDVNQESDDCGAIYCGRNTLQRGTEISYNFIHDLFTTEQLPYGFQSAIYWDDDQTGISAHHNIIRNSPVDLSSNGSVDCNFSENTSINIRTKRWHYINGGYSVNHDSGSEAVGYVFSSYIKHPEIYFEKYPTLKSLFALKANDPLLAKYNKLKNNLAVASCDKTTGSNTLQYGQVSGNLEIEECNDFVDPEKQDFRIKADSETAKKVKGIITDEFDIEKIGLINNISLNKESAPFEHIYPINGATAVQASNLEFIWERAFGATLYRLVIATDPELKNVVYDEEVPYTLQKVECLENGKVYYWKVYAINRSRDLFSSWESSSCVYSFRTSIYDNINTSYLDEEIEALYTKMDSISESDEVGVYPVGTKDELNYKIRKAQILKNTPFGLLRQSVVDHMTATLSGALSKLGMVNKGFLDIGDYIKDESKWSGKYDIGEDGSIGVTGNATTAKQAGTVGLANTTGSCMYSMDLMLNTDNWAMFAFSKFIDMAPYSVANTGYAICAKDDVVELQVSTGTAHTVVETVNKSFANDGKYHHIEFGFIEIGIGNLVVLYVDGEPWIEYLDIFNTGVNTNCEFSMYIVNNEKELIRVKPSDSTSSKEEFDKMLERNLHKAAKAVLDKFESQDAVSLYRNGAKKIFTPKGVFDVSYAPNTTIGGSLMVAFDKVDDIYDVETLEENGRCYVVSDGKKEITNTAKQGDYTMVSITEVLELLGHATTWSGSHETLVDGTIIFMNNVSYLDKARELMKVLEKYTTDYMFQ